jgi:hypothetical protein
MVTVVSFSFKVCLGFLFAGSESLLHFMKICNVRMANGFGSLSKCKGIIWENAISC